MTTEDTHENLPELQAKSWPGRILKTGLIFSCGVIAGAVIESMLDDRETSSEQPTPDEEEDNDDKTEAEASAADHENGDADREADINNTSESASYIT